MDIESVGLFYQELNKDNLYRIDEVYHEDVVFEDAAHRLEGLEQLNSYFAQLYVNVEQCQFTILSHQQQGQSGFITWEMDLQHPKLAKGRSVKVQGVSHLKLQDNKVIYHRDYFDLGEMVYEHIPLLGSLIKTIKQRLGQ